MSSKDKKGVSSVRDHIKKRGATDLNYFRKECEATAYYHQEIFDKFSPRLDELVARLNKELPREVNESMKIKRCLKSNPAAIRTAAEIVASELLGIREGELREMLPSIDIRLSQTSTAIAHQEAVNAAVGLFIIIVDEVWQYQWELKFLIKDDSDASHCSGDTDP
eukprot:NODE_700_length_792_cov_553.849028_g692_i0.p2 GENE.NODE_700_length_792_cov_553.849028_g692_i0~~NODE_700_length_792_cov_553.849028_g692_i0.p2  ORF type:complete len:184 (+),score=32.77 NODE_700_length_792_cov_553.849028_g692_i0:58-552(+)